MRAARASTRIVITGAAVSLMLLTIVAAATHVLVRRTILADVDEEIETLSVAIASDFELRGITAVQHEELRAGIEANAIAFRLERHSALLIDNGRIRAASGDLVRHASFQSAVPFLRLGERPFTAREPFSGQQRLSRFRVIHLSGRAAGAILIIFRSVEPMLNSLEALDVALVAFVIIGFVGGAIILTLSVRRALRPVERITAFAERVTATDLAQRVAVETTGIEFSRLADVINALLDRLQRAFDAQRRLIADAAHELKTPAAVIAAEAQELGRGTLPDASRQAIETIVRAARGMAREVDDLLVLARGDAMPAARDPVDLSTAVEEAVASIGSVAVERHVGVRVSTAADCVVAGDRAGIVRLIANLVSNAVRYTEPGTDVEIVTSADSQRCSLEIRDRGPGIAPEARQRIFERFTRLPSARHTFPEGSGLGLAIVDQVARAHGASIEVDAREGGGSVFRVRFPR